MREIHPEESTLFLQYDVIVILPDIMGNYSTGQLQSIAAGVIYDENHIWISHLLYSPEYSENATEVVRVKSLVFS